MNGYIAWRIDVYEDIRYRDYDLWEAYVEDLKVSQDPLSTCKQGLPVKIERFPPCKWCIRLDYYYDNVNDKGFSFETMCHMIRSHFEPEEHKRGMMAKWNSTTLKTIMAKNEDKSAEECLEMLIKELQSCVYACLKLAPTLEGLQRPAFVDNGIQEI